MPSAEAVRGGSNQLSGYASMGIPLWGMGADSPRSSLADAWAMAPCTGRLRCVAVAPGTGEQGIQKCYSVDSLRRLATVRCLSRFPQSRHDLRPRGTGAGQFPEPQRTNLHRARFSCRLRSASTQRWTDALAVIAPAGAVRTSLVGKGGQ